MIPSIPWSPWLVISISSIWKFHVLALETKNNDGPSEKQGKHFELNGKLRVCPFVQICSNHNETWNSDCELYRMRCLCKEGAAGCVDPKYDHAHVEYFGTCTQLRVRTPSADQRHS